MEDLRWIDPREPYRDGGPAWEGSGGDLLFGGGSLPYGTEAELSAVRQRCRRLLLENEFALSGHENRISYLVGSGHRCTVVCRGEPTAAALAACGRVQAEWDRFYELQGWGERQREIVLRLDRDGECFLSLAPASRDRGWLLPRFIDPEEVFTPENAVGRADAKFGVLSEPDDPETAAGYYVNGRLRPAREIQHRKANVDSSARRGLPLFYPVLANLERAERLLKAMSVLAQTQASVAVIRKHTQSAAAVQAFVAGRASPMLSQGPDPRPRQLLRAGTVVDVPAGMDYQFPSVGVNASQLVSVLQAELRAIAARLVMPEFMLSQDASNGNYASVLVAEGPAVKHFRRLQATLVREDGRIREQFLQRLVQAGVISLEERSLVDFKVEPPALEVRDGKAEAEKNEILLRNGVKSRRTWQMELGLDPNVEERQRAAEERRVQAPS